MAIRQRVYEQQSPLGRIVKWALITTAVVAVLVGGGLFFVAPHITAVDQPARQKVSDALLPPDQTLKKVNVVSTLGFSLNYDNHTYQSYAEVGDKNAGTTSSSALLSGQTYENNDLRVTRAYNFVRIRPIESVNAARALTPEPPELDVFATVTSDDLAAAAKVPANTNMSQLSLFVQLDENQRQAQKVLDDGTIVNIDMTKPVTATVGGVAYQKVRYTTTNTNHRITDVRYDDCYYVIQNNQPYSICVSGVRPTQVSAASLVEQVFNSLTFQQPQASIGGGAVSTPTQNTAAPGKVSFLFPLARLTNANITSNATASVSSNSGAANSTDGNSNESALLTITPEYYGDANSLQAIAKVQPSVVRIGMLYCADLSLKFESGATATTLSNACTGSLSSGVFISKDGYIATTGHAIRSQKKALVNGYIDLAPTQSDMLDRLQRVLDYLISSKIILQSDADYLETGASIGDQEALAKVDNIASVIPNNYIDAVNEQYSYAVQPSNQPIVINTSDSSKPTFAYSNSVLNAKYVASDYDATKSVQESFGQDTPTQDVGLLKVSGNFQDVPIAQNQLMNTNDVLSTIGYPSYTDGTIAIDTSHNLPVVTSSKVEQIYNYNGDQLVQTDTPVLPGNDGAPVVDGNGSLAGFAAYGFSYCPDQLCFANGTVRTVAELSNLLNENNISLNTGSSASKSWFSGVDQYFRANYSASASAFSSAAGLYAFNQWATPLQKLAQAGEGTALDTSLMNTLQQVMIVVLVIAVALTLILLVVYLIHRYRLKKLQVGHYGSTDNSSNFAPTTPSAPPTLPPNQPSAFQPATAVFPQGPQQPLDQAASPALPIRDQPSSWSNPFGSASPQQQTPGQQNTPTLDAPKQDPKPLSGPVEDPFYK